MEPSGAVVVAGLVGLLFVEEVGVPLLVFPADGMLITAGVLAAGGAAPIWVLLPVLVLVDMGGATLGYLWVRTLRRGALRGPAQRLERLRAVGVLTGRLRAAGAPGVFVTRLVPGTRVYTNLAAGLIDLRPRTFLLGMLPASALWVGGIALLGYLIGNRARPYLARAQDLSLVALVVMAALLAGYLLVRVVRGHHTSVVPCPGRRQ